MQLRSLADADVAALLAVVSGQSVADVRNALIETLPDLLAPYLTASGELAAVFFEDLRAESAARGTFYAESVALAVPAGRVDATARWAVAPLVDEASGSTVQSRLSGSVSRLIMDASRDTIAANGAREATQFQRMPRPNCCAFCGMLASRPVSMAYQTKGAAGGSVRYERDGKTWTGTASHDECHCVVVPIYGGTEMAELARETRLGFETKYRQSLTSEDGEVLNASKDILAEYRRYHGTR